MCVDHHVHGVLCSVMKTVWVQVIEGNSIMFNCTSIQNTTNSVPATSSGLCSGLSAVYYNDWAVSHSYPAGPLGPFSSSVIVGCLQLSSSPPPQLTTLMP